MRILLVSSEFPPGPGGIGRHALDLSLALAGKGFIVDIYTNIDYVESEVIKRFKKELPGQIILHHFKRYGLLTYLLRLIRVLWAIMSNSYSRLIFTGKFPLWTGGLVKFIYGNNRKIEFFIHGSEINPYGKIIRSLTHWALGKADKIWAVSEFTKSIIPEKIRARKEIRILPNGIHPSKWPAPDLVEPYTSWKGYPKLLTVGSISPRKGQHRVINALPDLIRKFPDIHYHIVGMEANTEYLKEKINIPGLSNYFTLHGRLPGKNKLSKAYKTCDIYIILSENQPDGDVEGFGISILEANLYGIPAIGARGCGIEDAIKPGINGELVDGNKSEEIIDAVIKIINNVDKYSKGIKDWITIHDWNTLINDFIQNT